MNDPVWSPSGALIAFSSGDASCTNADGIRLDRAQVWVVQADGKHLRSLTTSDPITGGPVDSSPSWSPDGRRIAFARFDVQTSKGGIYVVGSDGRGLEPVSTRTALSLDWSHDGHLIAFVPGVNAGPYYSAANRVGLLDIRSRQVVMTFRVTDPYDLAWSPRTNTLAVTTGNRAISIFDTSGKVVRQIPIARPGRLALDGVTWAPDGRRLAYSFGGDIFTVGLNGQRAKKIATGTAPDWRP